MMPIHQSKVALDRPIEWVPEDFLHDPRPNEPRARPVPDSAVATALRAQISSVKKNIGQAREEAARNQRRAAALPASQLRERQLWIAEANRAADRAWLLTVGLRSLLTVWNQARKEARQ